MAGARLRVSHVRFCWQAQHLKTAGVGVGETFFVRFWPLRGCSCGSGGELLRFRSVRNRGPACEPRGALSLWRVTLARREFCHPLRNRGPVRKSGGGRSPPPLVRVDSGASRMVAA